MKKRIFLLFAALVVVLGIFLFHYWRSYPVEADQSNLKECVEDYYLRGREYTPPTIKLYDAVTVGNATHVLMELDEQLGEVRLKQGFTGHYDITGMGYGDGNFTWDILEDGEDKYLIFGGRNTGQVISRIEVKVGHTVYALNLPAQDRFFVSKKVSSDTAVSPMAVDINEMTFYNAQGEDITADIVF